MIAGLDKRGAIAGTAAIVGAAAVLLVLGAARSGAAADRLTGSLNVQLPAAASDHIYAAPGTAGRPIVVIDAGHGGSDPGAVSVSGQVSEKQLTLALAGELRDLLVQRGRVRVAMTRTDDRYLTLEDRAAIARRLGAGLFVSLHMDSAPNPLARGASIYSLSDVASDAEAARFAAAQNRGTVAVVEDGSARALLSDLAMRDQMDASAAFATRLVGKSAGRFGLRPEPHRFAAFHVLRRAGTPAVLFEAGYISNADDELLLRDPKHRSAIALSLAQAIETDVAARVRAQS
ncbi:MAG: N-acetylmuramoyl-L-alanine amidase [Sphingomicrobium sp.]